MSSKMEVLSKKKILVWGAAALLLIAGLVILIAGVVREGRPKEQSLLETVEAYKGYTREVGREEYDFYAALVKRDLTEEISEEALDERVKEYANTVNATFFLGNKLGLCEPYSFQNLQTQMQNENNARKLKKEKGEPIYGLEQFELNGYFQYVISNLKIDLVDYLTEHADSAMIEQAKAHYEENREAYRQLSSITYRMTENGETTIKNQSREELRSLQNTDGELLDLLAEASEGDVFSYEWNGSLREVEVTAVIYQDSSFEENRTTALRAYVEGQVYDGLIAKAAEDNPVSFV